MFSLEKAKFDYEPYPISYAPDVFSPDDYDQLSRSYPEIELFKHMPKLGDKYSLSERNNADNYVRFLRKYALWNKFYTYVKSDRFVQDCLDNLKAHNIDLGLDKFTVVSKPGRKYRRSIFSRLAGKREVRARFEFSVMGGQGSHILPHTDEPNKLITLVISMIRPGEWDEAWGGGTQVCLPKDRTRIYNQINKYMGFDDVDLIRSYGFVPNQCILFVKTYNSWHQVAPINAPAGAPMRRTITINIEDVS